MKVSLITLAVVALACASTSLSFSDSDVLNFALNLECLEAEYYSWAALGHGLSSTQRGGGPPSTGGMKAKLGEYQAIAEEIAMDEIAHVELLRAALGPLAVPCPQIDIGSAFSAAADAALGTTLSPPFSPYSDFVKFLHGALLFEDVGVVAYNGAIGVIRTPAYAAAARSIMAVEAYHAGIVRSKLSEEFNTIVKPYNVPVSAIVGAIGPTLATLLGLPKDVLTLGNPHKMPNLVPVNMYSEANAVTPDKVLNVVYLGTANMGGFFPMGVNGLFGQTRGMLTDVCTGSGKAMRYQQCGGKFFSGPTCCDGYNTCVMKNENYSNCQPFGIPADMVMWYGQCGGKNYMGSTTCEPMSTCEYVNEFYSQCKPMKM